MDLAKIPKEVAAAFDYHKELWKSTSDDSKALAFMAIPFSTVGGHALVLQNYAKKYPAAYAKAIANGYEAEINVHDELAEMIDMWLNKPYVGDEKRDVENFARMVTKYFRQNG